VPIPENVGDAMKADKPMGLGLGLCGQSCARLNPLPQAQVLFRFNDSDVEWLHCVTKRSILLQTFELNVTLELLPG